MPVILEKIRFKIKLTAVNALIKISLFFDWPRLAAAALLLVASRIKPVRLSDYTVLCLGRSVFTEDIKAMSAYSGRIEYVTIWRSYFQTIFRYFVNGLEAKKITEANYHAEDFCRRGKKDYYLFLDRMLPRLNKLIGFKAVLSCNFGYLEQQELAKVLEKNEIPLIILHKEGIIDPTTYDNFINQFKGRKLIGTKMLFYNHLIKDALVSLNIPGLIESKTEIVGVPRLDNYYIYETEVKSDRPKQITLFSFLPEDKYRYIKLDLEQIKEIDRISAEFHKAFMEFAVRHPDYKVIIKTKRSAHYINYVKNILAENFKGDIPNLSITNIGSPFDLIRDSRAVAGFNSTTLIEAVMAKKNIFSPAFGEIFKGKDWDYFKGYGELVNYVKDVGELEKRVLGESEHLQYDGGKRNEFLKRFIYKLDGQSSRRAEDAILKIIK